MSESEETDPYDKGREAMDALFEVIEGEVVETVRITKRHEQYHDVKVLLSEFPIQWIEVNPRYVKVDGELVGMSDMETGDEMFMEKAELSKVEKLPGTEGHNLQLNFRDSERKEIHD